MVQTLKKEVQEKILRGAEVVFSNDGFGGATVAAIAREAGVSSGNVYRYFDDKEALFYSVVDDSFVSELMRILRKRVGSLVDADNLENAGAEAQEDAERLLGFWLEHRRKVIIVFDRAQGTRYEGFSGDFVEALVRPSISKLKAASGLERLPPVVRFTLRNLFSSTVRTIVSILENQRSDDAVREAFAAFWSYQLAGLAGLERWVCDAR